MKLLNIKQPRHRDKISMVLGDMYVIWICMYVCNKYI